jgi:hypothetical protein
MVRSFLGNCEPAKSRSVPPALAAADGPKVTQLAEVGLSVCLKLCFSWVGISWVTLYI